MKVWTKPNVAAYRDVLLEQNISIRRSLTWVGGAWLVRSVVGILAAAILYATIYRDTIESLETRGLIVDYQEQLILNAACLPLGLILGLLLYVILGVGVPHLVAKGLFKGKGRFEQTLFLYSAVATPPILVTTLLSVLPLGLTASLIVWNILMLSAVYSIWLYTVAIRATYSIGWLASLFSVLSPVTLFGLFCCCCQLLVVTAGGIRDL